MSEMWRYCYKPRISVGARGEWGRGVGVEVGYCSVVVQSCKSLGGVREVEVLFCHSEYIIL